VAERLQEAVRNQPCHIAMGVGAASRLTRHTAHALGSIPLRGRPGREPIYTVAQHIA
jgi:class 3 adenylate cyclase